MEFHRWLKQFLLVIALATPVFGQPGQLTVRVDQPGVKISPMLYGLMTEEINHSYDGGLYAELIQNRVFKDNAGRPDHWSLVRSGSAQGAISLDADAPLNPDLPRSLRLDITKVGGGERVGVANDGYWGIPVRPNTTYHASFYAKAAAGSDMGLTINIESNDGQSIFATALVPAITRDWKKYQVTLSTAQIAASAANRFVISADRTGSVSLNLVSLFPPTFNDRPNGTRIDLMQKLGDLHPAFLRFPGGNYLEGNTINDRFDWKKTLGSLEQRPGHLGPWRYRSSDGLGLLEFLDWCDDLHMEPLLAVFAGYALRGQHIDPGPALAPFVQDALDEIEYCTGDASTQWGRQRAAAGHPAPFKIRYVEIGNEDWFDKSKSYDGRFAQFYDAIKAKYPDLQLIATTAVTSRKPDLLDDHFYRSARAMEHDARHYDKTSRTGPRIFVGEWASREGRPTPTYNAALGDAAWLTGLERNSDVVVMSCYAPLLVNVNPGASQWSTNLIGYDALNSFGSPSYYVQKMFAENRGDTVLPVDIVPQSLAPAPAAPPVGGVGVSTWATVAEFKDAKVVSGQTMLLQSDFSGGTSGWRTRGSGTWAAVDGALRQSTLQQNCRATAGNADWTDYTYTVKARKISGSEGFLILFHYVDNDTFIAWNVGGWGNTRTRLEKAHDFTTEEFGPSSPLTVEAGRWYDVRIEVKGRGIRCYLDDKLVTEATDDPGPPPASLFATASRDDGSGDVIVKVVNVASDPQQMQIQLQGVKEVAAGATADELRGQPGDQNTLDAPLKDAPRREVIAESAPKFVHEFPAYSVTVLRLAAK